MLLVRRQFLETIARTPDEWVRHGMRNSVPCGRREGGVEVPEGCIRSSVQIYAGPNEYARISASLVVYLADVAAVDGKGRRVNG